MAERVKSSADDASSEPETGPAQAPERDGESTPTSTAPEPAEPKPTLVDESESEQTLVDNAESESEQTLVNESEQTLVDASQQTLLEESEQTFVDESKSAPVVDAAKSSAPAANIPAPALAKKGERRGLDALAVAAMLSFVLVGGLLVFGFAQALVPAAEAQLGAACRPLAPEPRTGAIPELELEDLDGNPVSLQDYAGKFMVVNFWATWCEPCTREWPDLDTLAARVSARDDVVVLAISVDESLSDIGPFVERMGLSETPVTILRAKDPEAHQRFGSEKIPDTYFVDRKGQLEAVFINVREWGRAKGVRCVEASADRS